VCVCVCARVSLCNVTWTTLKLCFQVTEEFVWNCCRDAVLAANTLFSPAANSVCLSAVINRRYLVSA